MELVLQKTINSLVWIACGILVLTIRILIIQSTSILIWETLGLIMIAYGSAKLLWVLARRGSSEPSVP
jgi:hypothetical protein